MKTINGGVCAAKGFSAGGIHCGIRKNRTKRDLALILSETSASAAAVYTTNLVKGAPLAVTKKHLANGHASAIICNSGNANTCNANGEEIAEETCALRILSSPPRALSVSRWTSPRSRTGFPLSALLFPPMKTEAKVRRRAL